MKKFFALLLLTVALVPSCTNKKSNKFVLGLDDSFPPLGFRDSENKIVGYDIDLADEVCKRMGVQLVCQPIDWAAKEMELNTGELISPRRAPPPPF